MIGPSFFYNKYSYINLVCSFLNHSLKNGINKETPFAITLFAKLVLIQFKNYSYVEKLLKIAITISEKFNNEKIKQTAC